MNAFRIVPLRKEFADSLRSTRKDDAGNDVVELLATGYGPCRLSLTPFQPGVDKRLLFNYTPFAKKNAFTQSGPLFIHAREVEPYTNVHRFPPAIKADKKNFPLSLIGYDAEQQMVFTQLVGDANVDELIPQIFRERTDVAYLHSRNAEAQCYICTIERT